MVEMPPQSREVFTSDFLEEHVEDLFNGISRPEHMKCELLRINSYKHRNHETYRGHVWPTQLSKAGFYFNPNTDETVCLWCELRIEASHWRKGRDPFVEHKARSPHCVYITGRCENNVPFQTKNQRLNNLSYLEPKQVSSTTTNRASSGRVVTDFGGATGDSGGSIGVPSEHIAAPVTQESTNTFHIEPRARLTPAPNNHSEVAQSLPARSNLGDSLYQEQARPQARSEPPFQSLPVFPNPRGGRSSEGASPGSLGSVEQDHPNEVARSAVTDTHSGPGAPASLPYQNQSRNNSAPASLPYQMMNNRLNSANNNSLTGRANSMNSDGDGVDPLQRMKSEEARLMTFARWPNRAAVAPEELARAAFFYTGSTDRVQCAFCENVLRNWEQGDNPSFEHRRHFPRCRFVLGHDVGNIPIPLDQRQRAVDNLNTRSPGMQPASASHRIPPATQPPPAPAPTRSAGVNALGMMGVNTELPKHPEFAIEGSRLMTYRTWRVDMAQPADVLCRAGFFYTGQDDNVRCFFCDGGLRNWEREDDPFTEHARWFPRCAFIREVKGDEFVNSLTTRYPRVQNLPYVPPQMPAAVPAVPRPAAPPAATTGNTPATRPAGGTPAARPATRPPPGGTSGSSGYHTGSPSNSGSSGGSIPGVQYRVEEREVKARMDTPAVRAVLDMGFDRNVVLAAIRKQLRQRGEDFSSAEMLLEALFDEEDLQIREEEEMEAVDEEPAPAPAPTPSAEQGSEMRMQPGGGQPAVPPAPSSESAPVAPPGGAGSAAVPSNPSAAPNNEGATSTLPSNTTGEDTNTTTEGATGNSDTNNSTGGTTSTKKRRKPKRKPAKLGDNRTPPPEGAGEDSGVVSSGNNKHNTETKTLLEENRQLKDQRMCKVCMDAEANIVFLPCGHLVCCANCAPALRNCAVCRSLIRGTVRTYLS